MAQTKEISKTTKKLKSEEKPQNAYFLSLELENVRCFGERQTIDFSDSNGNWKYWTIILGDNGTGKSTILQVLTNFLDTIVLVDYIKGKQKSFSIKNSEKLSDFFLQNYPLAFTKLTLGQMMKSLKLSCDLEKPFFSAMFAYGASRKAGKTFISEQSKGNFYDTLFDETALLINPEEWLLQADYASKRNSGSQKKREKQLETVKNILIKILPDIDDIRFGEKDIENKTLSTPIVEFHTYYGWVEAKDLSLGYRTSMAWIVDFASRMFDLYPESENPLAEPAVVLIDEIDLHLHPKWQRDLLPWLSDLFPNTQFIVTTHSPLIVQSAVARDANIAVCRREGDHVVIDQSIEAVKNWRADQILTSDLFGLETARPKETEKLLQEKEDILSKAKLTKKDEKRLAELEEEIGFLPVSENSEDNEAMEVIKKAADWLKTQEK